MGLKDWEPLTSSKRGPGEQSCALPDSLVSSVVAGLVLPVKFDVFVKEFCNVFRLFRSAEEVYSVDKMRSKGAEKEGHEWGVR